MPLPAPYAPPWKRLGEDLVATLAWLGLKARELWRRNGEGSLPVPGFWPRRAVRLFWPLLLAVTLLGAVAVTTHLEKRAPPAASPQTPETPAKGEAGFPARTIPPPRDDPEPPAAPEADLEGDREGKEVVETGHEPEAEEDVAAETEPEGGAPEEAAPADGDPLLQLWNTEDREPLVETITTEPANATLTLQLNDRFLELAAAERKDWAERWRMRADALGYSHLRLLDANQHLLGREAQVGSGMILLEPRASARPSR